MIRQIQTMTEGSFRTKIDGEDCTVFTNTILDNWHVVMVVSSTRLFESIRVSMIL